MKKILFLSLLLACTGSGYAQIRSKNAVLYLGKSMMPFVGNKATLLQHLTEYDTASYGQPPKAPDDVVVLVGIEDGKKGLLVYVMSDIKLWREAAFLEFTDESEQVPRVYFIEHPVRNSLKIFRYNGEGECEVGLYGYDEREGRWEFIDASDNPCPSYRE